MSHRVKIWPGDLEHPAGARDRKKYLYNPKTSILHGSATDPNFYFNLQQSSFVKVLEKAGYEISIQNWDADCPIYSCITILRALLVEQANPAHWKILQTFMDHDQVGCQFHGPKVQDY